MPPQIFCPGFDHLLYHFLNHVHYLYILLCVCVCVCVCDIFLSVFVLCTVYIAFSPRRHDGWGMCESNLLSLSHSHPCLSAPNTFPLSSSPSLSLLHTQCLLTHTHTCTSLLSLIPFSLSLSSPLLSSPLSFFLCLPLLLSSDSFRVLLS